MKFQFTCILLLLLASTILTQNETTKWLNKISLCTNVVINDANANSTAKLAIVKECRVKFTSMLKDGVLLPYTFTLLDMNKTDVSEYLFNKSELTLENRGLKSIGEFAINMPKLERLNLRSNELNETTVNANAFELIKKLKYLDISRNKFEVIPDQLLRNLFDLEYLNVSFNLLKTFEFKFGFYGHFKFKVIDLSYNKNVTQINNADFSQLRGNLIEVFNFSNCNLNRVNSGSLARFYHLKYYSIENNYNLNYESLRGLLHIWTQKLEYLNMNNLNLYFNNRYSSIDLVLQKFQNSLKYLHLAGNNIILNDNKDFFEKQIKSYKNLQMINLSSNRNFFPVNNTNMTLNLSLNLNLNEIYLSNVNLNSMKNLVLNKNTELVDLSVNQIVQLDGFNIDEYPAMRKLNLSSNQFQDLSSIIRSSRFCENVTQSNSTTVFLDISNNKQLVLNHTDVQCLSQHSKVYINNIKGAYCDLKLIDLIKNLTVQQTESLNKLECAFVDAELNICKNYTEPIDRNGIKQDKRKRTSIKAIDYKKFCLKN